jgi:hypothetical protein
MLLVWIKIQDVEDQLVTSSGCHWVCQWQQQWTVLITLVLRTFTSSPWRESRVVWTVYLLLALVIWLWPLSRRGSLILGRRSCLLSLLGSVSLGAERTVFSCTLKVILFLLLFYFGVSPFLAVFVYLSGVYLLPSMFIFFVLIGCLSLVYHLLIYVVIITTLTRDPSYYCSQIACKSSSPFFIWVCFLILCSLRPAILN